MIHCIDSCRTYEILLQDSGLAPKPRPDWNVISPEEGDIAHVDENDSLYRFDGEKWNLIEPHEGDIIHVADSDYRYDGTDWVLIIKEEE